MVEFSDVIDVGKEFATEFSQKNITFMAAGIAYNAFLSLAPILVVFLVIVSTVGGGLEQQVVEISRNSLPAPIADIVVQVFQGGAGDPAASVVGMVVLIWGTLKVFRGLDTAFSEIYETTRKNTFVEKMVDGVVVLLALFFAIVATIGVTAVFASFSDVIPYVGYITSLILVIGLVVAFLPMYYRFPDTDVSLRDILPGAAVAAVGWAAFQALFQVYLTFTGGGSGSLFGGVIVVITWLYFSGLVLLSGAVINAILGGHTTGKAGGVGSGSSVYDTHREEEMDREKFATYLADLQESLSDHPERSRSTTQTFSVGRYRRPDGTVTVIEQSKPENGEREMSIGFRWRSSAGSPEIDRQSSKGQ